MSSKCQLKTEGYTITFELFGKVRTPDMDIKTEIEFFLHPHPRHGSLSVQSGTTWLFVSDLESLLRYLEDHIVSLQHDANSVSNIFVNQDLDFTLQAFSGDVQLPNDGEFSILFMLNIGRRDETSSSTYVGGESAVSVAEVRHFVAAVQGVLKNDATQRTGILDA